MIVKCPECELPVSDKAVSCPHCGYPMKKYKKTKAKKRNKRRRLPNGFGQISEIQNRNLRKPYRAMVTVGKTATGRPICKLLKPISYFETYNDAYAALVEYNKNPYELDKELTVKELYEKWFEEYGETIKDSSKRTIVAAWAYCSSLYNMPVSDVRSYHIKGCMEHGSIKYKGEIRKASAETKSRIKSLFNLMLDYALEHELVLTNYARTFKLSDNIYKDKEVKQAHIPFTDEEIDKLWKHMDDMKYIDLILIQCYGGWRPQELGLIELNNVDLENDIIYGGMKTKAGTNRPVPILPKINPLIEKRYQEAKELGSTYLLNCTDTVSHRYSYKLTYDKYRHRFESIKEKLELNPDHRAHDGRMHFVTMAKKSGVDEYAIKYIVGHAIQDITERVYTERGVDWLKEEMQKIKDQ